MAFNRKELNAFTVESEIKRWFLTSSGGCSYRSFWWASDPFHNWFLEHKSKLEQLERLRSEDTRRCLMITHTFESCWIPSQNKVEWPWRYRSRSKVITTKYGKNPSRTVDATERTRFSRSRPNDLENIGHGQRSSHATHPLILVIICVKYEKNPSRTVDTTERTRFSKSRSNDLEDIGQGQRSSHATHLLISIIICTKYGKNLLGTVDAKERTRFSRPTPNDLDDIGQGQRSLYATHPL